MIELRAAGGGAASVRAAGAQVLSWTPAGESRSRLYLSPRARFADGEPTRGGIPLCFPQFADQGPLPMHGFARTARWLPLPSAGTLDRAAFRLEDSPGSRALWPHRFRAEVSVRVARRSLSVTLSVDNVGDAPFEFTCALHTYFAIDDLDALSLRGLSGARYRDKRLGRGGLTETGPELRIDGAIDRVYHAVPPSLVLAEGTRATRIRAFGFTDIVVWNPGPERAAATDDLGPGSERDLLCVEAAVARAPIRLSPGQHWRGGQRLVALG
jgi:glucose-6-phosphate 1-epimerase